jgi:multidrug resistance protein, MATE family
LALILTSTVIHVLASLLFVGGFKLEFTGVCLATLVYNFSKIVIALLYLKYTPEFKDKYGVKLLSKESVENLWNQFKVGIGYTLMMAQGWWAFEVVTLMSTYLGRVTQQAQTILELLAIMNYMIPIALEISASILIGNAIGAGSVALIKHYFKWSMYVALCIGLASEIILIGLRDQIISCFTENEEVTAKIQNAWPAFCFFAFLDILTAIAGSAIWAAGLQ